MTVVIQTTTEIPVAASAETGKLGMMHLKRFWSKCLLIKINKIPQNSFHEEWQLDKTMLYALNLGLEQTIIHLFHNFLSFEQFEDWVIETAGEPLQENVLRFNRLFFNSSSETYSDNNKVLNKDQLQFWEDNGYIIVKNAITKADCEQAIAAICDYININRDKPESWYKQHPARQGIMVQLFQHPILNKIRQAASIRGAFEQLWQRTDIWATTDRVGFNPPETNTWKFPGPDLHWDCSLNLPIPFALQGILYLADTEPHQGAFTLVPGFQHRIKDWLAALPEGTNPRRENLHALGSTPLAAEAGDFIIWHQALPHGSSPNSSSKPRFVQYITYSPVDEEHAAEWI